MLICICPDPLECPAIGSDVSCFPWCDYLEEANKTDEMSLHERLPTSDL